MQPLDVLNRLANAKTRDQKEQILLEAYALNCLEFFEAARLAADPFINFGITRAAEITEDDGDAGSFTFAEFRILCNQLQNRSFDNEAGARAAIRAAAERCHAPTWNQLYRRVLLKNPVTDLTLLSRVYKRLGADAAPFCIPTFRCQLSGIERGKISGERLVDAKLHGTRLLALVSRGIVDLRTADGAIADQPDVAHGLEPLAQKTVAGVVLDGVLTAEGKFVLFDIVPLDAFKLGRCEVIQQKRREVLEKMHRSGVFAETPHVRVHSQIRVNLDHEDEQERLQEFALSASAHGYSRIMLKRPDASYTCKRTTAWVERPIDACL